MFIGQDRENDQAEAAQDAQDAEELRIAFTDGITAATPNEHDEADQDHDEAEEGHAGFSGHGAADELQQEADPDADVCL